jgi:hypothetical protein
MNLPPLIYDFSHAMIDGVHLGPRRELTLDLAPLMWEGPHGRPLEGVHIRFGAIENFDEVTEAFATAPHERSELAWLRYADGARPGRLLVELMFERIDLRLVIRCRNLQVSGPPLPPSHRDSGA